MKVFLTGGTGFIGSHFIHKGLEKGLSIKALKRKEGAQTKIKLNQEPEWLLKTYNELKIEDFKDCSVLVHLAAHSANVPYDTLGNCIIYNVLEPLALFEKARLAGIKKFVVAGSCFEYGKSGDRFDFIPVNAPLEPTQTYPASKAMSSIAFSQFALENNLNLSYHRIFQVYGEGEVESRLWPSLKRAALAGLDFPMTSGEQIRDFINVENVADYFVNYCIADDKQNSGVRMHNVGSGIPTTLFDFCNYWWKQWQAKGNIIIGKIQYREGEIMRYVPEINLSKNNPKSVEI